MLARSVARPLKTESTSLGFGFVFYFLRTSLSLASVFRPMLARSVARPLLRAKSRALRGCGLNTRLRVGVSRVLTRFAPVVRTHQTKK